jgi:WD40 repeat protein
LTCCSQNMSSLLPFHLEQTLTPSQKNDSDRMEGDSIYVFDIFASPSKKLVSFTTSEGPTHIYAMNLSNLTRIASLAGNNIRNICFSNDDRFVVTSDEHGSVQVWDIRQSNAVMSRDLELGELFGLDVSSNIYAVGSETSVTVGDLRKNLVPVQQLVDIHTQSVRVIKFSNTHLHSAADDGLIHMYELSNLCEDGLSGVINVGNGVNRMGFIGDVVWSITHLHECQVWNRETCLQVGTTINRSTFATSANAEWDYYLIDANAHDDSLFLYIGNAAGEVLITKLVLDGGQMLCAPIGQLKGGHEECVIRGAWSNAGNFDRVLTAGEDGQVCVWHGGKKRK